MNEEQFNFIVTVTIKGKKQNRIVKATDSLSARFKTYHKIMDEEKIKDFSISEVKQRKGK